MANSVTGSPKRFDVDDRTMLCEIHEKVCGLTMLVEVAWGNHRVLCGASARTRGTGGDGRHQATPEPSVGCEIERVPPEPPSAGLSAAPGVRRPRRHEGGSFEGMP